METVGAFCKRYGPGRLPGASRPTVGAGYAVATAALTAAVAFVVLTSVQRLLVGGPLTGTGSLTYVGPFAIPLVVPSAFVGGAVATGPMLVGMDKPVHVLQRGDEVKDIVNLAGVAVVDARNRAQ